MEGKSWHESKTIWFNVLSGIVAVAMALQAPEAGIPQQGVAILGSIVTLGNVILRLITDKPIGK